MNTIMLSLLSLLFSFLLTIVFIKVFIYVMNRFKIFQIINPDTPSAHLEKRNTPTMGGICFLLSSTISIAVFKQYSTSLCFLTIDFDVEFCPHWWNRRYHESREEGIYWTNLTEKTCYANTCSCIELLSCSDL